MQAYNEGAPNQRAPKQNPHEEQRLRAADAAATVSPMRLGQRLDDEEEG